MITSSKQVFLVISTITMTGAANAGGLLSRFDGTVVEISSTSCKDRCIDSRTTISVSGDSVTWSGPGSTKTYHLGNNEGSAPGSTMNVSVVGNTISFLDSYATSTSRYDITVSENSCRVRMPTSGNGWAVSKSSCIISAGSPARAAPPSKPEKPLKDIVDSRCYKLNVVQTKEQCGNKYQFWHNNTVTASKAPGCPATFRFTFTNPDGTPSEGGTLPVGATFQTCGGRPRGVNASVRQ